MSGLSRNLRPSSRWIKHPSSCVGKVEPLEFAQHDMVSQEPKRRLMPVATFAARKEPVCWIRVMFSILWRRGLLLLDFAQLNLSKKPPKDSLFRCRSNPSKTYGNQSTWQCFHFSQNQHMKDQCGFVIEVAPAELAQLDPLPRAPKWQFLCVAQKLWKHMQINQHENCEPSQNNSIWKLV